MSRFRVRLALDVPKPRSAAVRGLGAPDPAESADARGVVCSERCAKSVRIERTRRDMARYMVQCRVKLRTAGAKNALRLVHQRMERAQRLWDKWMKCRRNLLFRRLPLSLTLALRVAGRLALLLPSCYRLFLHKTAHLVGVIHHRQTCDRIRSAYFKNVDRGLRW